MKIGTMVRSSLLALFIFSASSARADFTQWTVTTGSQPLLGTFGAITVTGTFDTGGPGTSSITAVETQPIGGGGTVSYTYTFSGPLDGPDYSDQDSQLPPPPPCILGCLPPGPPLTVTLHISTVGLGGAPGPYELSTSFEDGIEPYSGFVEATGTAMTTTTPEPSEWVPASALMAIGFAGLFVKRMRQRRP